MNNKIILLGIILLFSACKNESSNNENIDLEVIKSYRNERIKSIKIDSAEAVMLIIKQKLQEVYDLGTLNSNHKNDSLSLAQMQSYFFESDSNLRNGILSEIDTLGVKRISVHEIEPLADSLIADSLGFVRYRVNYHYKAKNLIDSSEKTIGYILKRDEDKPDSLFKFYFYESELPLENDTISAGVTQ